MVVLVPVTNGSLLIDGRRRHNAAQPEIDNHLPVVFIWNGLTHKKQGQALAIFSEVLHLVHGILIGERSNCLTPDSKGAFK